jgi:hypothetical protein
VVVCVVANGRGRARVGEAEFVAWLVSVQDYQTAFTV